MFTARWLLALCPVWREMGASPRAVSPLLAPRTHSLLHSLVGQAELSCWDGSSMAPRCEHTAVRLPGDCILRTVGGPAGLIASLAASREARGPGSSVWLRLEGEGRWGAASGALWAQRKLSEQGKAYGRWGRWWGWPRSPWGWSEPEILFPHAPQKDPVHRGGPGGSFCPMTLVWLPLCSLFHHELWVPAMYYDLGVPVGMNGATSLLPRPHGAGELRGR